MLHRGSPENPRDAVLPGAPKILEGVLEMGNDATGHQRRARFADWVVDSANPLTARVMANRIWQHVFGSGLVVTGGDFGRAGGLAHAPSVTRLAGCRIRSTFPSRGNSLVDEGIHSYAGYFRCLSPLEHAHGNRIAEGCRFNLALALSAPAS